MHSPARPPRYPFGGARPGPVRPRGEGKALPPPPPGFAPVDDARRESSPPHGVRAPSLTAALRHAERTVLPAVAQRRKGGDRDGLGRWWQRCVASAVSAGLEGGAGGVGLK